MTINKDRIFITLDKRRELEIELESLANSGRHEIAHRLDEAKALGDLSENAEYHQAREDQSHMESRIEEIEYILKYGEIIEKNSDGKINVGSEVVIMKKGEGKEIIYTIVGTQEADIFKGKIAFSSPLASAMIGKSSGEEFEFETPSGDVQKFVVISIK